MIRFIRFPEPDQESFAFYDTVVDKFLTFNGVQSFDSFAEIEESYIYNINDDSKNYDFERLKNLYQK